MTTRPRTNTLAANAAGVATALAFLAEEAEAAVQVFTPDPSPYSNSSVSFNPTTSDINSCFMNLVNMNSCSGTQPEFYVNNDGNINGLEGLVQDALAPFASGVTLTTADFSVASIVTGAIPEPLTTAIIAGSVALAV